LDKKYNLVKRKELHTEDNHKRFKKLREIIESRNLGLKYDQYIDITTNRAQKKKIEELQVMVL